MYDIVVVGGGLGGLMSGALLANRGKKVLLLEQHTVVGGCATIFRRGRFKLEVGLHELDGMDKNDIKMRAINELRLKEKVDFIKTPEFYRFQTAGLDITMPYGIKEAKRVLNKYFPNDKKAIEKFFNRISRIRKELARRERMMNKLPLPIMDKMLMPFYPILYPYIVFNEWQTVGVFVDSITKNEKLKLALLANVGYYSDDPHRLSLIYYAAAQSSYFEGGSYFIKGGSQELSNALAKIIVDNGGEVKTESMVTKIILDDTKKIARGVEYYHVKDEHKVRTQVFTNIVITNANIRQMVNKLLPKNVVPRYREKINRARVGCSLSSIFFIFKRPLSELGVHNYTCFYGNMPENTTVREITEDLHNERKFLNYTIVDYGQIDSQLTLQKEDTTGTVCFVDYMKNWEHLSQEEYEAKKEQEAQRYIDDLEEKIPGFKDNIRRYEFATPKTIEKYTLNYKGAPYGFDQIPSQAGRYRFQVNTPIKNLYCSSAWSFPGGGFSGAMISAMVCADAIKRA